jgi:hypothetical protein
MSNPKKDGEDPSKPDGVDENHPMIAKPRTPDEKADDHSLSDDVKKTMLIKRPDELTDADVDEIGTLAEDDGEMIIVGKGGGPLLGDAVKKPGIDYLNQVAQDRRSLDGTRTRSLKKENAGEQTRIIDRSNPDDDDGKTKVRPSKKKVQTGETTVGNATNGEPSVEEIAAKLKEITDLTGTVNLPRGANAVKAIAKIAEDTERSKKPVKAIEVPKDDDKPAID